MYCIYNVDNICTSMSLCTSLVCSYFQNYFVDTISICYLYKVYQILEALRMRRDPMRFYPFKSGMMFGCKKREPSWSKSHWNYVKSLNLWIKKILSWGYDMRIHDIFIEGRFLGVYLGDWCMADGNVMVWCHDVFKWDWREGTKIWQISTKDPWFFKQVQDKKEGGVQLQLVTRVDKFARASCPLWSFSRWPWMF